MLGMARRWRRGCSTRGPACARFSLVELLVVIGIIAIIIGILLPALNKARGGGAADGVLNHVRQIYTHPVDAEYYASYAHPDGHAEGKTHLNVNEYLAAIHRPIRQRWFGVEFEQAFSEQYR